MEQPATAAGRCPTCGAWYQRDALLCTICGSPLTSTTGVGAPPTTQTRADDVLPARDIPPLHPHDTPEPAHAAASAPLTAESSPPADAGQQKRCAWCGALNAESEQNCQHCGAAFPRPDQDDALLRASQERIRVANDSIATIRKERERKGIGRFFGR